MDKDVMHNTTTRINNKQTKNNVYRNSQNQNQACTNMVFSEVENNHRKQYRKPNVKFRKWDKKTLKEKSVSKTRLHKQAYSEWMELDFIETCYTKVKYNFYETVKVHTEISKTIKEQSMIP